MALIILAFVGLPSSFAAPLPVAPACDPRRLQVTALRKAAQIGAPDRKTADGFGAANGMTASAVERRYAATGDMVCGGGIMAQAQVVVSNDTIVTAAHVFDITADCKSVKPISSCRFITRIDGIEKSYKLKSVAGTGHKCPFPKNKGLKRLLGRNDWIVLKLEQSTDARIKPYRIPAAGEKALANGQRVVSVSKSFDWPKDGTGTLHERPRHYGDCEANDVDVEFDGNAGLAKTNCDMSGGSSGGSLLTPGDDPVLLGVVRGETDAKRSVLCDAERYKNDVNAYDADCWAGTYAMVTGDLRKAIADATKPPPNTPKQGPNVPTPEGFRLPKMNL